MSFFKKLVKEFDELRGADDKKEEQPSQGEHHSQHGGGYGGSLSPKLDGHDAQWGKNMIG